MTIFARLLLTVVVAVTALAPLRGQGVLDYPQWRGADRDGAASSFSEPASWPQTLRRRWQVDVGDGYATPIVIGSTVYAFSRRDGQEVLTALDAATGRERWRSAYEAPYTPSQPTVAHGSGPKATPLFLNGRVFTQGISGIVSAFEAATGKRLWQTREPSEHPFYSAASSPAGEGDSVYVHPGNYEPLTAFDAASGRVRWTVGDGGFFMSPLIVSLEGTRQVVTVTQSAIIGVSIPDGRLLWRYPWPGANGGSMPVAYGDTIITSADAGVIALKPMRRGDSWTAETVWETKDVSMYLSNPVVIDDTLYGLSKRNSGQFFDRCTNRRRPVAGNATRGHEHGRGQSARRAVPAER